MTDVRVKKITMEDGWSFYRLLITFHKERATLHYNLRVNNAPFQAIQQFNTWLQKNVSGAVLKLTDKYHNGVVLRTRDTSFELYTENEPDGIQSQLTLPIADVKGAFDHLVTMLLQEGDNNKIITSKQKDVPQSSSSSSSSESESESESL